MQLQEGLDPKILLDYGFEALDDEYKEEWGMDSSDTLYYHKGYVLNLGHSRRGQFYYLLYDGHFGLYASKPDGDGGVLSLTTKDVFVRLVEDGIVTD